MRTDEEREKWREEMRQKREERRREAAERHRAAPFVRPLVAKAFKTLRRSGLICRMAFKCCMSCACAELEPMLKKSGKRAAVYFHRQDDASFRDGYELHIRYAPLDGEDIPAWKALGQEVVEALKEQGLVVEWDGDVYNTIVVKTVESYRALQPVEAT